MFFKKPMYKTVLSLFIIFISHTLTAQPKVSVPETVRQLGIFHQDEIISYNFVIRNEGDSPLKIADVKTSCSCTTTEFDKEIAPGKLGKVRTKINASDLEGPISKNITVLTNDASRPELTLTIRATVVAWTIVKPNYARFSIVQGEIDDASQTCVVAASDGKLFKILRTSATVPGVKITFREATQAQRLPGLSGNQWAVTIQLNNNIGIGPISDYVILTTDHPRQKEIKIPISGVVRPAFKIEPSKMDLGRITNTRDVDKSIFIRANTLKNEDVVITDATSTVKGIKIVLKPTANRNEYQLQITLDPAIDKGIFNGKILVHTSYSFMPVVEIEIKGEVL